MANWAYTRWTNLGVVKNPGWPNWLWSTGQTPSLGIHQLDKPWLVVKNLGWSNVLWSTEPTPALYCSGQVFFHPIDLSCQRNAPSPTARTSQERLSHIDRHPFLPRQPPVLNKYLSLIEYFEWSFVVRQQHEGEQAQRQTTPPITKLAVRCGLSNAGQIADRTSGGMESREGLIWNLT